MSIFNPKLNPIRFYDKATEPNHITTFLNVYNWRQRNKYTPALYPVKFYRDHVKNRPISIQFQILDAIDENLTIYKFNDATQLWDIEGEVIPVEITPIGWLSSKVNKYEYTPTEEGVYYLDFPGANYRSDTFVVHDETKLLQRLIEVRYYNTINDYGMVFYDDAALVYESTTFFTGFGVDGIKNDIAGYETDRGGFGKTRSTPMETKKLYITDYHMTYAPLINGIFSLDRIYVNGVQYENKEPVDKSDSEKVDISTFTIDLTEANTNFFTQ